MPTNPNDREAVERIARGLTKAQKEWLLQLPASCIRSYQPALKLEAADLVTFVQRPMSQPMCSPTALGLAVRTHLLTKDQSNGQG